MNNILL